MKIAISLVAVACVALLAWFGNYLIDGVATLPVKYVTCSDRDGRHDSREASELDGFRKCIDKEATRFLDRDYAETKDLVKAFLTLLSATLVASITFSEKIVDVSTAEGLPLNMMIVCWLLLLAAIVSAGTGLGFMAIAAGIAAGAPEYSVYPAASRGVQLIVLACITFVVSLCAMVAAGVSSLRQKRRAKAPKRHLEAALTWT